MADDFEIVPYRKSKSPVWANFGFVKYPGKAVSTTHYACKICREVFPYSGNTTNLHSHIARKHPEMNESPTSSPKIGRSKPVETFKQTSLLSLPINSTRSKVITNSIARFMVKNLRPYSVVENEGFRHLVKVLEPRYTMPSRSHFSESVIPKLYEEAKKNLLEKLKDTVFVALTTDGWTSRATESYVTITGCHVNNEWQLESYVLQVS